MLASTMSSWAFGGFWILYEDSKPANTLIGYTNIAVRQNKEPPFLKAKEAVQRGSEFRNFGGADQLLTPRWRYSSAEIIESFRRL